MTMGATTGRYVKRADRLSLPGVAFAVCVRADVGRSGPRDQYREKRWDGADVAVQYRDRGKWGAPEFASVDRPDQLRDWMESRARPGYTNWALAPDAVEALTLSRWWSYAESCGVDSDDRRRRDGNQHAPTHDSGRVRLSQLVCSERCGLLDYRQRGIRWRWVSASNWWPDGGPDQQSTKRAVGGVGTVPGRESVLRVGVGATAPAALLSRFRGLCEWWARVATAPLGVTAGQLAWGVLRSHIEPRTLCTHSDDETHRLERACCHGGRASVWYCGRVRRARYAGTLTSAAPVGERTAPVSGPVFRVDVSSMHPAVLRDELFPVARVGLVGATPVRQVIDLMPLYGVIARVTVETQSPEYPYRRGDDVLYPTGRFLTTLAGPELLRAHKEGAIREVHRYAYYKMGRPFAGAMDRLITERAKHKEAGERDMEALDKLVANSLGGKLSQRQGKWVRRINEDVPGAWGEWWRLSAESGKLARYRHVMGCAWEWCDDKCGRGPHTSAFAYLTSYVRCRMRDIRAVLPDRSCIAQDTDGLFLLYSGIEALRSAGMLARTGAGALREVDSVNSAQFWGPRHYLWGKDWVLSGFREPTVSRDGRTVTHEVRTPLFGAKGTSAPETTRSVFADASFPDPAQFGAVGKDGWITAPKVYSARKLEGE